MIEQKKALNKGLIKVACFSLYYIKNIIVLLSIHTLVASAYLCINFNRGAEHA